MNDEFEKRSVESPIAYLETMQKMQNELIDSSMKYCESEIGKVLYALDFIIELCKSSLLVEDSISSLEEYLVKIREVSRPMDVVIVRFTESMKILNDSLFLTLTGRYVIARMLYRIAVECIVRGVYYYGLSSDGLREQAIASTNGGYLAFLKRVDGILEERVDLSPLELEQHIVEGLEKEEKRPPGFNAMFRQLVSWDLIVNPGPERIEEYIHMITKDVYGAYSQAIHTDLTTTYYYSEKTIPQFNLRVIWGAQFSESELQSILSGLLDMIDFIGAMCLSALSDEITGIKQTEHLKSTLDKYTSRNKDCQLCQEVALEIVDDCETSRPSISRQS